jgi:hypothetical protein
MKAYAAQFKSESDDEESGLIPAHSSARSPTSGPMAATIARERAGACEACVERTLVRYGGPFTVVLLTAGVIAGCHRYVTPNIAPQGAGGPIEHIRIGLAAVALVFLAIVNSVDPGSLHLWSTRAGRPFELDSQPDGVDRTSEVTLKDGDVYRWCPTCRLWKPPRASHCSTCQRCYLRFDHHCPWIGSCVAESNHRFFASFVLFIGLAGGTVPVSMWMAFMSAAPPLTFHALGSQDPHASRIPVFANSSAMLGFLALMSTCYCGTLVCFGVASWVMLLCDTTTKERFGQDRHEIDCAETCHDMSTGAWQREMRRIVCGPVRLRQH